MYLLRTSFSVTTIKMKEQYGWTGIFKNILIIEAEKGNVISSYFWGYILPPLFAGMISMKFGAKYLLLYNIDGY